MADPKVKRKYTKTAAKWFKDGTTPTVQPAAPEAGVVVSGVWNSEEPKPGCNGTYSVAQKGRNTVVTVKDGVVYHADGGSSGHTMEWWQSLGVKFTLVEEAK